MEWPWKLVPPVCDDMPERHSQACGGRGSSRVALKTVLCVEGRPRWDVSSVGVIIGLLALLRTTGVF